MTAALSHISEAPKHAAYLTMKNQWLSHAPYYPGSSIIPYSYPNGQYIRPNTIYKERGRQGKSTASLQKSGNEHVSTPYAARAKRQRVSAKSVSGSNELTTAVSELAGNSNQSIASLPEMGKNPNGLAAPSSEPVKKKKKKAKLREKPLDLPGPLSVLAKERVQQGKENLMVDLEQVINREKDERIGIDSDEKEYVLRPANSFMLYRTAYRNVAEEVAKQSKRDVLSEIVAKSWAMESDDVHEEYEEWARKEMAQLLVHFKDYKYAPRRRKKDGTARKGRKNKKSNRKYRAGKPATRIATIACESPLHHERFAVGDTNEAAFTPNHGAEVPRSILPSDHTLPNYPTDHEPKVYEVQPYSVPFESYVYQHSSYGQSSYGQFPYNQTAYESLHNQLLQGQLPHEQSAYEQPSYESPVYEQPVYEIPFKPLPHQQLPPGPQADADILGCGSQGQPNDFALTSDPNYFAPQDTAPLMPLSPPVNEALDVYPDPHMPFPVAEADFETSHASPLTLYLDSLLPVVDNSTALLAEEPTEEPIEDLRHDSPLANVDPILSANYNNTPFLDEDPTSIIRHDSLVDGCLDPSLTVNNNSTTAATLEYAAWNTSLTAMATAALEEQQRLEQRSRINHHLHDDGIDSLLDGSQDDENIFGRHFAEAMKASEADREGDFDAPWSPDGTHKQCHLTGC